MAPCVRGLRRRICRHKAPSPASWQGEPAGHLISQHPGLGIYSQLFSHLRVTREGRRESGVGTTKPPTDVAGLPSSAASPTSLRNNGVAVWRELGHCLHINPSPPHCGAAQSRPQRAILLPPSRLSHTAESVMAAARAEPVWTRQAGGRGKEARGQRLGRRTVPTACRSAQCGDRQDLGQTG